MTEKILTIREVAGLLRITEKTAYRLASTGTIPGFKVGGSWRFDRSHIAEWIRHQTAMRRSGKRRNDRKERN